MSHPVQGDGDEPAGGRFAKWSWTPGRPASPGLTIATTRSFHLNNRNIDRRNDVNTAEFARTGQPGKDKILVLSG